MRAWQDIYVNADSSQDKIQWRTPIDQQKINGSPAIEEHQEIREQINNLIRIKKMRKAVSLVLNRKLQSDVIPLIRNYVGEDY